MNKILEVKLIRLNPKFAFAEHINEKGEKEDYFVPSRGVRSAMLGDKVLLRTKKSLGSKPEGLIIKILERGNEKYLGVLEKNQNGKLIFVADALKIPMPALLPNNVSARPGDRVLASVKQYGSSHEQTIMQVDEVFGSNEKASVCANALLSEEGIDFEFDSLVLDEAKKIANYKISAKDIAERLDLRESLIFTIDSAETKDIDDAISLEQSDNGFLLGVHIADVSHYVSPGTALDIEALARGNSIYYVNKVIPMLPKELSNGICSLNPQEDRLAFSAFMTLDEAGNLMSYEFKKSIIRSRLQGVYSEINSIFAEEESEAVSKKYKDCKKTLIQMRSLMEKRQAIKKESGAFNLDTTEAKFIFDEKGELREISQRKRGLSEEMIEEFMVLANEAAASFARKKNIPFLYRTHDKPSAERVADFTESLKFLGVLNLGIKDTLNQKQISQILESLKDSDLSEPISYRVLRAMAKAEYSTEALGHFGLNLENYSHFTSPIRRYSDLAVHRVLGDVLAGKSEDKKWRSKEAARLAKVALQCTNREILAQTLERSIEDIYIADFLKPKIGESFKGKVSGFTQSGMFIDLANTGSGFVPFSSMERFLKVEILGGVIAKSTKFELRIGQVLDVVLVSAEVASGRLDFVLEKDYEKFKKQIHTQQVITRPAKPIKIKKTGNFMKNKSFGKNKKKKY